MGSTPCWLMMAELSDVHRQKPPEIRADHSYSCCLATNQICKSDLGQHMKVIQI